MGVNIKKALGVDQAGTILIQNEVDKVVQALVDYKNPLRMNLPRRPGKGNAWIVNRRTAGTTAAIFVNDVEEPGDNDGTYVQVTFTYRTILTRGKVTRKMQAIGMNYIDVLAMEIEEKARDFRDFEDNAIVAGDNATNPKEFDGLSILIPASQEVGMTTAAGGDPLTLIKLDEALDKAIGNPDMMVMARRTRRELVSLLQAQQRFVNVLEVRGGFKLPSHNDVPIFISTNVSITETFDGTTVTGNTNGATSSIYILDTEFVFMAELTPLQVMPLAKTTSQNDRFDIFVDEALVISNTLMASRLIGIKAV